MANRNKPPPISERTEKRQRKGVWPPQPKGPEHALQEAVTILLEARASSTGWTEEERRHQACRPYDFPTWTGLSLNEPASAIDVCERVAGVYLRAAYRENRRPNLTELRTEFASIEKRSGQLSRQLARLKQHYNLIQRPNDYSETARYAQIKKHHELLGEEALPHFDTEVNLVPGTLCEELQTLSLYMNALNSALSERFRAERARRSDMPAIFEATARWQLVNTGWRLFEDQQLNPSGTRVGGRLYSFLQAIGLWASGENLKLTHYFRAYVAMRQEYDAVVDALYHLAHSGKYSSANFERAVREGNVLHEIPTGLLTRARKYFERQQQLSDELRDGPRTRRNRE